MAQARSHRRTLRGRTRARQGWSFLAAGPPLLVRRLAQARSWRQAGGVSTAPRYYDYQLMLKKDFGPDHELRFFFFGSDDRIEIFGADFGGDFALGGGIRALTAFWRMQARYAYKINSKTRITAVAAYGETV